MSANVITTTGSAITSSIVGAQATAVGGYQTDPSLLPFVQEQVIGIYATGMRPGTQLYVFFDSKLVSNLVTPASLDFTIPNPQPTNFFATGTQGSALYSDSTGKVAGLLYLPPATFYTGAKTVIICDVNNLASLGSATTQATYVFNVFNFTSTVISGTATGTVTGSTQDSVTSTVVSTRPVTSALCTSSDNSQSTTTSVINNLTPPISVANVYNVINNAPSPAGSNTILNATSAANASYQQALSAISQNRLCDPIAQSFFIDDALFKTIDGVYVTSVDLYFQSADPNLGVTVDIVTMQAGIPTNVSIPFSSVHLNPSQITTLSQSSITSSTTSIPNTHVVFPSPIFLAAGYYYALRVTPDGSNPNYTIYTASVGQTDLITNQPITNNWGSGDLFTSTNDQTWTPIQNEYLKFNLNIANFSSSQGYVSLVNKDYEFLMVTNSTGYYTHGEYAFQQSNTLFSNTTISGNVFIISGQTITFTSNTTALSTFANGATTTSMPTGSLSNTSLLVVSNGSVYDVLAVNTSNSSTITTKNFCKFTSNSIAAATIQFAPLGRVRLSDATNYALTLDHSSANSSSYFTVNGSIIGVSSGTTATIATVRNKVINRFNPYISSTTFPGSIIQMNMQNTNRNATGSNAYQSTYFTNFALNNTNYFLNNEVVVMSKTNEILYNSGNKSLVANISLYTANTYLSPAIDLQSATILAYRNIINNAGVNENTKSGTTKNKYISQTVNLATGLDSEAFNVFINAYWPPNSTINVYGKFLCATDSGNFDSKDWTLLSLINANTLISDPYNLNSINEYQFTLPTLPPAVAQSGAINTTAGSTTVTGINTSFTTTTAAGALVVLFADASLQTFQVAQVASVANNTSLTLGSAANFATTVGVYETVTQPQQAFQNNMNGGIIRYYSNTTGAAYDSFISFAIKIDLLSSVSYQVPRILSLRSIASTV